MNCAECLDFIATADLDELAENSTLRLHVDRCRVCASAVQHVVVAEQQLERALSQRSDVAARHTAHQAVQVARRRRVSRLIMVALASVMAVTAWVAWIRVLLPAARITRAIARGSAITETLPLYCLSSPQAGDLVSPYLRSNGSMYYLAKPPLRVITVRATREELSAVRSLLARYDGDERRVCTAPVTATP